MEVLRNEESGPVAANKAKNSAVGIRMLVERVDLGRRLIVETTVKFTIHFARPFIREVWRKSEKIIFIIFFGFSPIIDRCAQEAKIERFRNSNLAQDEWKDATPLAPESMLLLQSNPCGHLIC
jgi:hypothetical protein